MSEVNETTVVEQATETVEVPEKNAETKESAPDVQDLMTEIAKLKRANDKLSSESAGWRKKYQSTLTEQEKASEAKAEQEAEREEKYNQLLRENQMNKVEKSYLAQGWTADEASRMATAEVDGDFDARMKILAEVDARKAKQVMADFLKSRPDIQYGTGNGMTKEQYDKLVDNYDVAALTKLKRENPAEYERLSKM